MNERTLKVLEYQKIIEILAEYTVSNLGKEIALELKPSSNIYEVKEWLQETDEAVEIILKKGNIPLEGIYDIRTTLKRAELGTILENGELLKISDTIAGIKKVKAYMKEDKDNDLYPIINDLINLLVNLDDIAKSINTVVLNEDEISDRASPELFSIRKKIKDMNARIREKLNNIITSVSYQKFLQEQIITIRNGRYVIPVKQEFKGSLSGIVHDQSSSGATLYIEPMIIVEMNNDLKQLKLKETDEVNKILLQLSKAISEKNQEIRTNLDILTTLDFIFAKAKFSLDLKCFKPIVNNSGWINLKKARHPLLAAEIVVPIDVHLGETFNILVITGPNTGGKTVSLKTVGLLVLMSQSGLFIPAAEGSEVSLFDYVFADIGDEQSIEQSLSTFSSHMKNIVSILNDVTEKSLVLLDELGAGTDPTEGAALAIAILEVLRSKQIKAIATTHYSEIKAYALITPDLSNGSVEFDIETLRPTYKLSIGNPGKSNAFEISKKLGLNEGIIEKAKEFMTKDKIKFEDIIVSLEESRKKAEEERSISEKLRYEAELMNQEASKRLNRINAQKENLIKNAHEEAKRIIESQKSELNIIMEELKEAMKKEAKEKLNTARKAELSLKRIENKAQNNLDNLAFKKFKNHMPPKNLKLGDLVRIIKLDKKGNVLSLPDENGNLTVQVGIMKVNANISDLKLEKDNKNEIFKEEYKEYINRKRGGIRDTNIPLEVDLRGKTLDEALLDVDKYLDDVYLTNIKSVTLIHGKGTGVLRSGITQLLKNHPHVKSYRTGGYYEGGFGVTIVEIK
ncbi:MAG: endonuclease MutS2 [Firmicutes bacterium]|nr:endonuclease MutS2 [Bacillota bacterium]